MRKTKLCAVRPMLRPRPQANLWFSLCSWYGEIAVDCIPHLPKVMGASLIVFGVVYARRRYMLMGGFGADAFQVPRFLGG